MTLPHWLDALTNAVEVGRPQAGIGCIEPARGECEARTCREAHLVGHAIRAHSALVCITTASSHAITGRAVGGRVTLVVADPTRRAVAGAIR